MVKTTQLFAPRQPRVIFWRAWLGAVLFCFGSTLAVARPNVVLIMVDDLDRLLMQDLLAQGRLPHFAATFERSGLDFRRFYVSNPICCPSRATLLTGVYSHNHKALTVMGPDALTFGLKYWVEDGEQEKKTFPVKLRAAGYRTAHIGKYLNGYGWDTEPTYIPPGYDDWQGLVDLSTYRMFNYELNDNGRLVRYGTRPEDYQTDVLAARAARFLETVSSRWPDEPFYLGLFPVAPHVEHRLADDVVAFATRRFLSSIRPAPRHLSRVTQSPAEGGVGALPTNRDFNPSTMPGKSPWMQGHYALDEIDLEDVRKQYRDRAAAMLAVDDLIGRVVAALRVTGQLDNTYLFFTSDNGWFYGEHRLTQKSLPYEAATRVPLYVAGPAVAAPDARDQLVSNPDLSPTILAIAGVADESADGRSMVGLFAPTPAPWTRRRILLEGYNVRDVANFLSRPTFAAVREFGVDRDFNFIGWDKGHVPRGDLRRYVPETASVELYDLSTDPNERVSVVPDAATLDALNPLLDALRTCSGKRCRQLEDQDLGVSTPSSLPADQTLHASYFRYPALKLIDYGLLRRPWPGAVAVAWVLGACAVSLVFWRRREARWVMVSGGLLAAILFGVFARHGYVKELAVPVIVVWGPIAIYLSRRAWMNRFGPSVCRHCQWTSHTSGIEGDRRS